MQALFAGILLSTLSSGALQSDDWTLVDGHDLYSFEVPSYMKPAEDLNDAASHQFQYVDDPYYKGGKELYAIVLFETKEEIASYDLGFEFDAYSYWKIAVESLRSGLDRYKVLTKNPVVERHNGGSLVKSDAKGKLGRVKVWYHLGVYEGEYAFYQILTWTVNDHYTYYKSDMERIVDSFSERQ